MHRRKVTLLSVGILLLLGFADEARTYTSGYSPQPGKRVRPIKFTGEMEAGKTYKAVVIYREGAGMWWPVGLRIPYHHAVHVGWDNVGDYPVVKKRQVEGRRLVFTYKVLSKDIWKVQDKWQWRTSYECHIIAVGEAR